MTRSKSRGAPPIEPTAEQQREGAFVIEDKGEES